MASKEIRTALKIAHEYRGCIALYLCVLVAATVSEGLGLGMLLPGLQALEGEGADNVFSRYARGVFSFLGLEYTFVNLILFFAAATLVKFALVSLSIYMARALSARITYDLRERSFQNVMDLPLAFFYRQKPGNLVATQNITARNAGMVFEYGTTVISAAFFLVLYVCINALISLKLTLLLFGLFGVSYFFSLARFRIGFEKGGEIKKSIDEINSYLFDVLSGVKTVKEFENVSYHAREYGRLIERFRQITMEMVVNRIIASLFQEPLLFVLTVVGIVMAVKVLHIPFVTLAVFLLVFVQIMPKVKLLNAQWLAFNENLPHLAKVQELAERGGKEYLPRGGVRLDAFRKEIRFEEVSFAYPEAGEESLAEVTAVLERGTTTGLVGASGGGKTTFVDLLLRLHDPTRGRIRVDGNDLRDILPSDWGRLIGVVEQDPHLFNDTILNNIRYGKIDATEEEVVRAAKTAYAEEFISKLPNGYQTVVGNRGFKLSGGQRQRLALARALVRSPEILVLDEATSALDSEFEQLIQSAIGRHRGQMTILIVAHRLSTMSDVDQILVIERGRIVESGTHGDLMGQQGRYRTLVKLQSRPDA